MVAQQVWIAQAATCWAERACWTGLVRIAQGDWVVQAHTDRTRVVQSHKTNWTTPDCCLFVIWAEGLMVQPTRPHKMNCC
ncbi:hypothetical protein HanIR_Chr05g0236131 [Helianthus annuus]|nr:hypothetical protein HanIR_Chr05g0236131 [Helianthus annuus]